jgi:hypothetical protein
MSQNNINENCRNPYTFLYTPECSTSELNDYIQGYKTYIDQMALYCSQSDNIISDETCNNFAENNIYIQNSQIQTDLKQNISNLCKDNINPDLNNLCINTYNIKPDVIIAEEAVKAKKAEEARIAEEAVKAKKAEEDNIPYDGIGAIIGFVSFIAILGGGYIYYRKKKKVSN